MTRSQLAVWCERVGYNAGMVAFATRQIETAKRAVMPRADARAGEEKSATVFNWSDGGDNITISGPSTHELHGFYDQVQSEVASVDQSNQQYSILALTDSSGNVSERYAYTAYGQPTFLNASATVQTSSAANNRYTYTAREWDATLGLHHFRARWMSGLTGRFLTRDPIGFRGSPWDLYEFLDGKSLVKRDAYGLQTASDIKDEVAGEVTMSTSSVLQCPRPCQADGKCKFKISLNGKCVNGVAEYALKLEYTPKRPTKEKDLTLRDCGIPAACYGGFNRAPNGTMCWTLNSGKECCATPNNFGGRLPWPIYDMDQIVWTRSVSMMIQGGENSFLKVLKVFQPSFHFKLNVIAGQGLSAFQSKILMRTMPSQPLRVRCILEEGCRGFARTTSIQDNAE